MFRRLFRTDKCKLEDEEESQLLLCDKKSANLNPTQKERRSIDEITKCESLSWTKQRSFFPLLSLDDSLLSKIYHHLPPIDQVCLALSCKRLYAGSEKARRHEDVIFPRLLQTRIPILCVNSKDVPRNQLLLRLENDNWKYCSRCLKLHPRTEFGPLSQIILPLKRSCDENAGVVDICPCYSYTLRDGEKNNQWAPQPHHYGNDKGLC